jgi:hypothetical protein
LFGEGCDCNNRYIRGEYVRFYFDLSNAYIAVPDRCRKGCFDVNGNPAVKYGPRCRCTSLQTFLLRV